jgi:hypothetical protein
MFELLSSMNEEDGKAVKIKMNKLRYLKKSLNDAILKWRGPFSLISKDSFWVKDYRFKAIGYDFHILLKKRNNLKKHNYQVIVKVIEEVFSSIYIFPIDYVETYAEKKYDKKEINKKFATDKEAIAYVEMWKTKLLEDHLQDIEWQLPINEELKLCS